MGFELLLSGQRFSGWTRARVSLGIEQMAAAFDLDVTRSWPGAETGAGAFRPIRPGAPCEVSLLGQRLLTGYVDEDSARLDARSTALSVSGRSRTADLIDCSAVHRTGQWAGRTLAQIAADLCKPFGIQVVVATPIGAPFASFALQEGETVFEALDRAARQRGVLLSVDGAGNLVILRTGDARSPGELIEGRNLESIDVRRSMRDRYSRYVIKGQSRGSDQDYGDTAAGPSASATDPGVPRHRPLIVIGEEQGGALADRARWEQQVRMGRGLSVSATVSGFEAAPGVLWQPNTRVRCVSPSTGVDSELLIVELAYVLDASGSRTDLTLAPPEAYSTVETVAASRLARKLGGRTAKPAADALGELR